MPVLGEREATILEYIIRDYIRSAVPVSSERLRKKSRLELSPASIRNTMAELDRDGYLEQPHTSGGRIPTDKAYRYFVDNFIEDRMNLMDENFPDHDQFLKFVAKRFGMFTVIARSPEGLISAGIDSVFSEPEFHDYETAQTFAEILEDLSGIADKYFDIAGASPTVHIGRENPFEEFENFSSIFAAPHKHGKSVVVFSVGPKRRDYESAVSVINYIAKNIL